MWQQEAVALEMSPGDEDPGKRQVVPRGCTRLYCGNDLGFFPCDWSVVPMREKKTDPTGPLRS